MNNDLRLDPDLLLQDIEKRKKTNSEGKLRVFLGMCPGVGKTFAMLKAAHVKKSEGIDIVVGVVETHNRIETKKLLFGLESIAQRKITYKDVEFEEMDLDAILARKPRIVLVDELAHTNVPGSRHPKRYQDVEELLKAGIDVYTTINIQHIETRSELVKKITGIEIKETVPDSLLSNAFQVELIDINPEDLIKRIKGGKVYLQERTVDALNNFFKVEHLIALRELALRFTAEVVDNQLTIEMSEKGINDTWHTTDRLLVAISHSPHSSKLLRAARRKAQTLEAPWIALYVENGMELSEEDRVQLNKNIKLAKDLGADFISIFDDNISNAIKRVAIQRNVSQVIMGRPDKRLGDFLRGGTILDQLANDLIDVDLIVLKQAQKRKRSIKLKIKKLFEIHSSVQSYYNSLTLILISSFGLHYLRDFIGYRSIGYFYLLIVLFVSSVAGKGVILFTALVCALSWNFFFIPPFNTFHVENRDDIMLFSTFFVVALVTGYLSNQKRKKNEILIEREERTNLLYEVSNKISKADTPLDILIIAEEAISQIVEMENEIYLVKEEDDTQINYEFVSKVYLNLTEAEKAVVAWSIKNKQKAGRFTDTLSSSTIVSIPIASASRNYGVLVFRANEKNVLSHLSSNLIEAIVQIVSEALEKNFFQKEAAMSNLLKESEKLHQALFNSISHEMKTPLTAIIGASSSLLENKSITEDEKQSYLNNIKESSYRLNRVVINLLDMSRLSGGVNKLQLEYFDFSEFLENLIFSFYKDERIRCDFPNEEILLKGDAKLLEHAFINLIQNAIQYSNRKEISISVEKINSLVQIKIQDQGIGIPRNEESKIFERFYRASNVGPGGTGLGLSIVKEVISLHQGIITAKNNEDQGAVFIIHLPIAEQVSL